MYRLVLKIGGFEDSAVGAGIASAYQVAILLASTYVYMLYLRAVMCVLYMCTAYNWDVVALFLSIFL